MHMKYFFVLLINCLIILTSTAQDSTIRKKDRKRDVLLQTSFGDIVVRLSDSTPLHRDNFLKLVKTHYYDSVLFHRVIQNFMIQSGDPDSKHAQTGQPLGNGGPEKRIPAEFRQTLFHKKGVIAAARDNNPEKASSACQFYIAQGKKYTDEEAVKIAQLFLEFGANINGNELVEKKDTPLVAAASLNADKVAIFYIESGANINHAGCHGGTALHWAAWCGRDKVVKRLVQEGAEINKKCIDFKATPLFWAVHGLKSGDKNDMNNYVECVRILVQAGADKNIPNVDGNTAFDLLDDEDVELKELLN